MIYDYLTTIGMLEYIAESPSQEHGGFHENAINTAKSALHYLPKKDIENFDYFEDILEDAVMLLMNHEQHECESWQKDYESFLQKYEDRRK